MIHYRQLDTNDVDVFAALHVQCWRDAYAGLMSPEMIESMTVAKRIEGWRKTLADPAVFALGAFDDVAAIGFLLSGPAREDAKHLADGQILAIYTLAAYWRKGIGQHFFAEAVRDWKARGGVSLCVEALASNERANSFYRAMGGVEVAPAHFSHAGEELPESRFVFELAGR